MACAATPQANDDGLDRVGPEIVRARDMGLLPVSRRALAGIDHTSLSFPSCSLLRFENNCLLDCGVPVRNLASLNLVRGRWRCNYLVATTGFIFLSLLRHVDEKKDVSSCAVELRERVTSSPMGNTSRCGGGLVGRPPTGLALPTSPLSTATLLQRLLSLPGSHHTSHITQLA